MDLPYGTTRDFVPSGWFGSCWHRLTIGHSRAFKRLKQHITNINSTKKHQLYKQHQSHQTHYLLVSPHHPTFQYLPMKSEAAQNRIVRHTNLDNLFYMHHFTHQQQSNDFNLSRRVRAEPVVTPRKKCGNVESIKHPVHMLWVYVLLDLNLNKIQFLICCCFSS